MIGPFTEESYEEAYAAFRWPRPGRFNIAEAVCGRWARSAPERVALLHLREDDTTDAWTYARLDRAANQLATLFAAQRLGRGSRVAVLLPQRPEALLTHLAVYKMAAVALPLFTLFGPEALAYRLNDAGAEIVVTDAANLPKLLAIRDEAPSLRVILSVDGPDEGGALGFWEEMAKARDAFASAETRLEDPAFLCYTSGTTGPPKGALHGHRALIGHLPAVQMWLQGVPQPDDVAWTPADWAWLGGLCNVLLPSLLYGVPLVSHRMAKFDPDRAFWIWEQFRVTVGFLPPTALKMMRLKGGGDAAELKLRAIGCGGEPLGVELLEWGRARLGLTINEFYGQTECNLVASNNAELMPVKPGSIGRATPGFRLAILDADGAPLPAETPGEIGVHRDTLALFLGYWGQPEATQKKFAGDWLRTGDEGRMDADGYVFFEARADDVINSAGYRIGPGEIEDCLMGHPAVAVAGVIGVPDALRGEAVKAYVVLREGVAARDGGADRDTLVAEIQGHVKARLSPHEYPREVAFVDALPMTATGKIMRRELKRRHADAVAPAIGDA